MADKGIVSRAKVEALVESIRAKTGVTGPLNFDTMKTALDNITGSSGGEDMLQQLVNAKGNCDYLFYNYKGKTLDFISNLDTSKIKEMDFMFYSCSNITTFPQLNTDNLYSVYRMCYTCSSLESTPIINMDKVHNANQMFNGCGKLTSVNLINVRVDLSLSSSTLLTLDSLIGLCKECINTGSAKTLTVGSTNLDKIQNSGKYYKFVDSSVTEVAVDEKGDIEECESTVTGSFSITDYMAMKHWTLA